MSEFINFRAALQKQFSKMAKNGNVLFISEASKDSVWETYLDSFEEGTNPLFRERTEHDCQCCKQFVRYVGRVLAEVDGKLVSVWDINVGGIYQPVADALNKLNVEAGIGGIFLHNEREIGKPQTVEVNSEGTITWNHFHQVVPESVYRRSGIGEEKGAVQTNRKVLQRSLDEITSDSVDIVLELISQDAIYRGTEHKATVELIKSLKSQYKVAENQDVFLWRKAVELKGVCSLRNTVIGTLLTDLSEGTDLEVAVKKFEDKVAPHNYKRSKSLITEKMKKEAQKTAQELGIEPSLLRRHATKGDIRVENVLFADQSVKPFMEDSVFDVLKPSNKSVVSNFDKVTEMSIDKFISDVLPTASTVELYLENSLEKHLMTLVAPVHDTAPNIMKWSNNFSWSYNGDVADSLIKERVKSAGGSVEGVLRFSIQWNDTVTNLNDLDAHCVTPRGSIISFRNRQDYTTGGNLDVDIIRPEGVAVENIIFPSEHKLVEGKYTFLVNTFNDRGGRDWDAQIEFDGKTLNYSYKGSTYSGQDQIVALVEYTKKGGFKLLGGMENSCTNKTVWGLDTNNFHKVEMMMHSPNHWDGECTGNKHTFFLLEGCKNPESVRGFYNEYLREDLNKHRKVFEVLAGKLKAEYSDEQLSGVGISSTLNKQVILKVTGKTSRVIKVNF